MQTKTKPVSTLENMSVRWRINGQRTDAKVLTKRMQFYNYSQKLRSFSNFGILLNNIITIDN